jgi:hypothetical protein
VDRTGSLIVESSEIAEAGRPSGSIVSCGFLQVNSPEVRAAQIGIDEVDPAEVGNTQVGSTEVGIDEVGTPEIGNAKVQSGINFRNAGEPRKGLHPRYRLPIQGVRFKSPPVTITAGPNRGGLVAYLFEPDGYQLELFQPPQPSIT